MKKKALSNPAKQADSLSGKYRVAIVDDHPLFRQGLIKMIESEGNLAVCSETDNAPAALEAIRKQDPDLVTVDISLKGTNGLELIKAICAEKPKIPILVISMHDESLYALRALRAGAKGYIMKDESLGFIAHAVSEVLEGKIYVSPVLNNQILTGFVSGGNNHGNPITDKLSDRELEVFENIGQDKTIRDIADELHLSIKTVETHREHIKEKLNVATARELVKVARSWVESEMQR